MEQKIYLNNDWYFSGEYKEEMLEAAYPEEKMEKVRLPHTCKELPFHYFDEHIYQMVSLYRRQLKVPAEWKGKKILLTIGAAAHDSEVFVNGEKAGEHHCGYTAFTVDLSDRLKYGEDNLLAVKVDSRENLNIPPFGFVVDYMTYGGIYRDVYLEVKEKQYLEDVFLKSEITQASGTFAQLSSEVTVSEAESGLSIRQWMREKAQTVKDADVQKRETQKDREAEYRLLGESKAATDSTVTKLQFPIENAKLWDIENPMLYEIKTELLQGDTVLDEKTISFGFRQAEFRKDGFYLNNQKVKIRGLNRHQSYPYVGYAMPKSMQIMDADILKKELGLNAVRTSHYPQSHDFLNRCDELGLLVFTEIPGWQHIGDEAWKAQAVKNTEDMVKQYRNHTSIILWGVRINESKDDDAFYEKTNEAARRLDDTRQTAGVRAHKKSSLLEDVYTYNDFSHDGKTPGCEPKKNVTSDLEKPYMISEYNGHMYPTKAFDWEEHRVSHAIRHANVLDAAAKEADIAGSFGWCMADYNTHKDFGSGDRICYHGVMDMFRNPKMAADIYTCQQEEIPHLSLSSSMDIGEHPGCNRGETWIFTNADSVKMYKNDRFIKEYKESDSPYRNLKHGPILIDDFIGDAIAKGENFKKKQAEEIKEALNLTARFGLSGLPKKVYFTAIKMILVYHMKPTQAVELYNRYVGDWGGASTTYRFEAIKDGKVVKTMTKCPMTKVQLQTKVSNTELTESHTYDVAAVRIQAVDENENLLPFYQEPVHLKTEGPIELIGQEVISLKGGMGGVYIRTTGKEGEAVLTIQSPQTGEQKIRFQVRTDKQTQLPG